jgi:integrase
MTAGGKRSKSKRYNISSYERKSRNHKGQPIKIWEASWDKPKQYLLDGKRAPIVGTSRDSEMIAIMRCEEKIEAFLASVNGDASTLEKRPRSTRSKFSEKNSDYTVQTFITEWYEAQVESDRWQPNTKTRIWQAYRDHIFPYLGAIKLDELDKKTVRIHFTKTLPNLKKKDKAGNPTEKRLMAQERIEYVFTQFRSAIRAADAKHFTNGNPVFDIVIKKNKKPAGDDAMIEELMMKMLEVFRNPKNDDADTLRFSLSFFLGMRRGEARGLCFSDIDNLDAEVPLINIQRQLGYVSKREGGEGHVFTPSTKTKRNRIVPIHHHTLGLIRKQKERVEEWKKSPEWKPQKGFEDLILIRKDGSFGILNKDNEVFADWLEKMKVEIPGVAPGSLRHASATWWATEVGQDEAFLKSVLGWSKKSDLNHYYTRSNQRQLKDQMSKGKNF